LKLEEKIYDELKKVIDPETNIDVLSMGLIEGLVVDEDKGDVEVTFRPSSPFCPLGFKLGIDIKNSITNLNEVKNLKIYVKDFYQKDLLEKLLNEQK